MDGVTLTDEQSKAVAAIWPVVEEKLKEAVRDMENERGEFTEKQLSDGEHLVDMWRQVGVTLTQRGYRHK